MFVTYCRSTAYVSDTQAEAEHVREAWDRSYPTIEHRVGRVVPLDRGTVRICEGHAGGGRYFVLWHDSLFCLGWDGEWCQAGEYARFSTKKDARAFAEAHGWHVYESPAKPLFCLGWDGEWCREERTTPGLSWNEVEVVVRVPGQIPQIEINGFVQLSPPKPLEDESPYARED